MARHYPTSFIDGTVPTSPITGEVIPGSPGSGGGGGGPVTQTPVFIQARNSAAVRIDDDDTDFQVPIDLVEYQSATGAPTVSGGNVVIPEDGFYRVSYTARLEKITNNGVTRCLISCLVNGVAPLAGQAPQTMRFNGAQRPVSHSFLYNFNAGDTVRLNGWRDNGGTGNDIDFVADGVTLAIELVGPASNAGIVQPGSFAQGANGSAFVDVSARDVPFIVPFSGTSLASATDPPTFSGNQAVINAAGIYWVSYSVGVIKQQGNQLQFALVEGLHNGAVMPGYAHVTNTLKDRLSEIPVNHAGFFHTFAVGDTFGLQITSLNGTNDIETIPDLTVVTLELKEAA